MELIAEIWDDLTSMKVTWGLTTGIAQGVCPDLVDGMTTLVRQ